MLQKKGSNFPGISLIFSTILHQKLVSCKKKFITNNFAPPEFFSSRYASFQWVSQDQFKNEGQLLDNV